MSTSLLVPPIVAGHAVAPCSICKAADCRPPYRDRSYSCSVISLNFSLVVVVGYTLLFWQSKRYSGFSVIVYLFPNKKI